ncbi:3-hydroxyacyl-CoA dehydrogenase family protein [Saccharopolyspora sp. NPDC002578]
MTGQDFARGLVVLGAGVMGLGIATLARGHGLAVELVDVDGAARDRARAAVDRQLRLARLMGVLPPDRATGELTVGSLPAALADAPAVVEAVSEEAGLKARVLAEVSAHVRPGTPLVSNTSSIPIDELAGSVVRPGDLVGVHFMNPPYLIGTVELVRASRTTGTAVERVAALLDLLGRRPVVVRDAPGFVTSRILHPMINNAVRVVAAGTADAESVDALMQDCLGHRTGPLRTADLIGLDNLADSLQVLWERTGDEACRPCELLLAKVRAGDLGRKTGRGFYDYEEGLA